MCGGKLRAHNGATAPPFGTYSAPFTWPAHWFKLFLFPFSFLKKFYAF